MSGNKLSFSLLLLLSLEFWRLKTCHIFLMHKKDSLSNNEMERERERKARILTARAYLEARAATIEASAIVVIVVPAEAGAVMALSRHPLTPRPLSQNVFPLSLSPSLSLSLSLTLSHPLS